MDQHQTFPVDSKVVHMEKRLTLRSHQVDIMSLDFWRGYSFCILLLIWHGKKVCHTIEGWLLADNLGMKLRNF